MVVKDSSHTSNGKTKSGGVLLCREDCRVETFTASTCSGVLAGYGPPIDACFNADPVDLLLITRNMIMCRLGSSRSTELQVRTECSLHYSYQLIYISKIKA